MYRLEQQKSTFNRKSYWFRLLSCFILFSFISNVVGQDIVRASVMEPPITIAFPAEMSSLIALTPPTLRAISIDPQDPFKMDFVVDSPDQGHVTKPNQEELALLVKYFFSFLTIPEGDLWVNLSPYEKDRIIPEEFELTNAGKDMLLQDYVLKQLASSLTHPDHELGKIFWKRVFERARIEYGTSNVPINSFNKVWVVPAKAVVYEENGAAFIAESHLKVLTEEDYLSIKKHSTTLSISSKRQKTEELSSEITREVIVPELQKEVNEGKYFAPLRQMYNSLILAIWFKKKLKDHLVSKVYVNQKKTLGIVLNEQQIKERIYAQYLKTVKKGVYNFIREDYDDKSHQAIPRKYFSGGFSFADAAMRVDFLSATGLDKIHDQARVAGKKLFRFTVLLNPLGISKKTLLSAATGMLMAAAAHGAQPSSVGSSSEFTQQIREDVSRASQVYDDLKTIYKDDTEVGRIGSALIHPIIPRFRQEREDLKPFISSDYIKGFPEGSDRMALHNAAIQLDIALKNKIEHWGSKNTSKNFQELETLKTAINQWGKTIEKATSESSTSTESLESRLATLEQQKQVIDAKIIDLQKQIDERDEKLHRASNPQAKSETNEVGSIQKKENSLIAQRNRLADKEGFMPPSNGEVSTIPQTNHNEAVPVAQAASPKIVPEAPKSTATTLNSNDQTSQRTAENKEYSLSQDVVPMSVEDHMVSRTSGIVSGFNPDKKEYKAGELIFSIINPELNTRIDQLNSQLQIQNKRLADLKDLYGKSAATLQEVVKAKQQVDNLSEELSKSYEEKVGNVVTAPHDFVVKSISIANGMEIAKGAELLNYYDQQRVRLNFKVSSTVNCFNQVKDFTINGQPVKSIESVEWSLDPQQKNAELSIVAISSSHIPVGQPIGLKATVVLSHSKSESLDAVKGQTQTIAQVRQVEQLIIRTPVDGTVNFFVHEGQNVEEGQVVAVVGHQHFDQEYRETMLSLRDISVQLNQAMDKDGTLLIKRDDLDNLKAQQATLLLRAKYLQDQVQRMDIRAMHSGVVTKLAAYEAKVFHSQDELLTISTGKVLIGDNKGSILLPQDIKINQGDPLVVETPQGTRLLGKVSVLNQAPYTTAVDWKGYQAVEVMAFDNQHVLQPNLPVKIIVPTDNEKRILDSLAVLVERNSQPQVSAPAGAPPPPSIDEELAKLISKGGIGPISAAGSNVPSNNVTTPLIAQQTNVPVVSLADVQRLVATNQLVIGEEELEVLKNKQAEKLPKATRFSLTGGVWMQDGKLAFSGGIKGTIDNMVGGGVSSGNAIGAAVPVVFQLAGNVIDVVSGKVQKETDLAVQMTQIAYHHMETEVYRQVNEGQNLLIEIGAAQQRIDQLKELLNDLQKARQVMQIREAGGFSLKIERDQIEKNIQETQAEIFSWQKKKEAWTVSLNALLGQSNANLHDQFSVSLPWDKQFSTIDEKTGNSMRATLIDEKSSNSKMKEALAAAKAVDMTIKLQGLDKLPGLNLAGLYITDGQGLSPIYDLVPGSVMHSSAMKGGANSIMQLEIPLYDSVANTKEAILSLEKKKSDLHLEKTRSELIREFEQTTANIKHLSQQIQEASDSYHNAYHVWELKANRPDIYLPYQLVNDRMEAVKWQQQIIDLKAQYFKEEATLRKMGLQLAEPKVSVPLVHDFQIAVSNAISGTLAYDQQWTTKPSTNATTTEFLQNEPADKVLTAGVVNYHIGEDAPNAWTLMRGENAGDSSGSLSTLKGIIMNDPNIFVRTEALRHFITEYQNNQQFLPALKDIVLHSSNPDVVWELLKFMSQNKDHDLRFFVQVINEAESNHNQLVTDLGFQSLRDIFMMYPDDLQGLAPSDFEPNSLYPDVSPDSANKVFLTFLTREPDNSVAKMRFLQSDYWSTDDLAKIYNNLVNLSNNKTDKYHEEMVNFSGLIHDSILRKEALRNIDEVFRPGGFKQLGSFVLNKDITTAVEIGTFADQNRTFLTNSPAWRQMQDYIHPKLYASAKEAAKGLISRSHPNGAAPLLSSAFNVPNPSGELAYFRSLGIEGQQDYINKSHDFPELARILTLQTPLRTLALNRLMTTSDGRVLTLKIYLDTSDPNLLKLIEEQAWLDLLKADIAANGNSAVNEILRSALEKMHERTQENWPLNLRLSTYSIPELHSLKDPRGQALAEAQIKKVATKVALNVINERMHYRPVLWAGYALQNSQEKQVQANIQHEIEREIDPIKVSAYLDHQNTVVSDPDAKSLLNEVSSIRDEVAGKIKTNDQTIPKFSHLYASILRVAEGIGVLILGLFINKYRKRILMRNESTEDAIRSVYKELIHDSKSDRQGPVIPPPPKSVYAPTVEALQSWRLRISQWSESEKPDTENLINDLNTIINNAEEVIQLMPYSPELMWSDGEEHLKNEDYQKTFSYFNLLAMNTLSLLKKSLQERKPDTVDSLRLQQDIDVLLEMIDYGSAFLRILDYRGTGIETVMKYKFDNSHWTERLWLYPLARRFLLYNSVLRWANKGIRNELPSLLMKGNALMPDFYENPTETIKESEKRLDNVINKGITSFNPTTNFARHGLKMRSFYSRMLPMIGLSLSLIGAFSLIFKVPGWTSLSGGLSWIGASTLLVSYFNFWKTHLEILKMQWNSEMLAAVNRLRKELKELLNLPEEEQNPEKEIVVLERQEGLEQVQMELNSKKPRVDMIVIIPQEESNQKNLQDYIISRHGRLIRNDVPVDVVFSQYKGSGNAYLDVLQKVKNNFETGVYKKQYPHLKSWEDARIMFVFNGKYEIQNGDIQYDLLDNSIMNGYRAVKTPTNGHVNSNGQGQHSGHILIYSRDAYFGPIPQLPEQGITLLTSRVNRDELDDFGWVNTGFTSTGKPEVYEILEKLNLDSEEQEDSTRIRKSKTLQFMKGRFNLNNRSLKQFPVLNGMVLVGSDAVKILGKIADEVQKEHSWEEFPRHLTGDLLIPMIIMSKLGNGNRARNMEEYILKRSQWSDIAGSNGNNGEKLNGNGKLKEIQGHLRDFYSFIEDNDPNITINAFVPHSKAVVWMHIAGEGAQREVVRFQKFSQDFAMKSVNSKDTGGIDLTQTAKTTEFRGEFQEGVSAEPSAVSVLKSFKGFEFQIIQYQPILNPTELFLSSNSNQSGLWFSHKDVSYRNSLLTVLPKQIL